MATSSFRLAVFLALFVSLAAGCDTAWSPPKAAERSEPEGSEPVVTYTTTRAADRLRIGTFNIQVFGESKMAKPEVVEVLVDVIRRFDVLAIQEVRSSDPSVVDELVQQVNADGSRYAYLLGPRLGRTSSKEQYLFIYDRNRLEVDRNACYTVEDPNDFLHREPLVARFRVIRPTGSGGFSFSLVNIHTDPDEVGVEINLLDDVFRAVQQDGSGEDDVVLLGDLNAGPREFGELGRLPYGVWLIDGEPTNTRRTQCYDNIFFDRRATTEFAGAAGIIDLATEYGLSLDEALAVSDHLPIWAEFSLTEAGSSTLAERPPVMPRY